MNTNFLERSYEPHKCEDCGDFYWSGYPPVYCPSCRAKVVLLQLSETSTRDEVITALMTLVDSFNRVLAQQKKRRKVICYKNYPSPDKAVFALHNGLLELAEEEGIDLRCVSYCADSVLPQTDCLKGLSLMSSALNAIIEILDKRAFGVAKNEYTY